MRYMTANEIRQTWLKFFEDKKHYIVPSASLIPNDDPTLLWINAGVAPLKKYFDGSETPISKRLTNVQKCIRTNDIDNVGKTARHHTFFEMLGNFSIGDYFKEEAITMAFELLTSPKYFNFPIEKLVITYYTEDIDAKNKWLELGIPEHQIIPIDDNYWEIGEGPSGPNTEIFFDRGEKYDKRGLELVKNDIENDRYIEIWNIVFSQYNAKADLPRNKYPELPNKNIDTGAGLERFACVLQNTETNFETDLFFPIIKEIEKISNVKYEGQMAFKVISDHIKTLVFSIADGAMLSNEGRGYVLRRLLRRAVKYGRNLGLMEPFLYKLVDSVILTMQDFYPELNNSKEIAQKIIIKEEEKFLETIADGEKHLYEAINKEPNQLSGQTAFKLYDTYGFPIELTVEYAAEKNITVDLDGFYLELEKQKNRSRQARENADSMSSQKEEYLNFNLKSKFTYDKLSLDTKVIAVFDEGIVLEETPFYATSGGQVYDKGWINGKEVLDVKKLPNGQHLHVINEKFNVGDIVSAKVCESTRINTAKNHTATHLLHQALKDVFGKHVVQQGSLVNDSYLRFDFNHFENITEEQILKIEKIVNDKINKKLNVIIKEMPINEAKKLGAMALFGEKYGDIVRVVTIDNYSIELCGGTHVTNTNQLNSFAVINFESIGSGIYRLTASTNNIIEQLYHQVEYISKEYQQLTEKAKSLNANLTFTISNFKGSYEDIINEKNKLVLARQQIFELEKENQEKENLNILQNAENFLPKNYTKKEIITTNIENTKVLKQLVDIIYDKINAETILLINVFDEKATFIAKTNGKTHAGNLIKQLSKLVNGSGGGRDTIAQGGTKDLSNLELALKEVKDLL